MFKVYCNKSEIFVLNREALASGSREIHKICIEVSPDWDGYLKAVVFTNNIPDAVNKHEAMPVYLDENNECTIPWEMFEVPDRDVYIGVYGTKDDSVLPTLWAKLNTVEQGTTMGEQEPSPPTPTVYQQILQMAEEMKNIAESIRTDADNGEFDGDDYILTDEDKRYIIAEAAAKASGVKFQPCGENEIDEYGKPLIDNPDPAIFYLTPSNEESPNLFYAWAYIDGAWERFEAGLPDLSNYVKNTDYGGPGKAGIVKIDSDGGSSGIFINGSNGMISVKRANYQQIDNRNNEYAPITASSYDYAVKKALTDNANASTNPQFSASWTDEDKASARELLGAVGSTDYSTSGKAGVVRADSKYGITVNSSGTLFTEPATVENIDDKTNKHRPIVPNVLDYAVKKALSDCKLSGEDAWTLEEQQSAQSLLGGQMIKTIAPDENGEYKVGIDELENGVYFTPKGAYVYFFRDDERNRLQLYGDSLLIINTMYNDDNSKAFLYLNGTMNGWGSINLSNRRRAYEYIPFGGFVAIGNTQTITGIKTFSTQPKMTAELTEDDNSTNIPTTAWVQALVQKKIEEALQN